eukprot:2374213-Prorocentrum_lima.AAC.1
MTSSLVGSEMCIRDSFYNPKPIQLGMGAFSGHNGIARQVLQGRDCHDSVSYTHLTLPTICSV